MKEKYLPVGTVVLLKGATKTLMITGYCSATPEEPNKVYDYVAYLFPEGGLAGEDVALFNHDQIGVVVHMGLDNDEFKVLDKKIKTAMAGGVTDAPENLPPFTPDNINAILAEINKHGDDMKPIAEPTAFDEEAIKKPVFTLPTLGETNKKEEKSSAADDDVEDDSTDSSVSVDASVPDGQPVLQLQPIYDSIAANSNNNSSSEPTSGGISGLARL